MRPSLRRIHGTACLTWPQNEEDALMLIFWRLFLGHLLADFTFQFNFIHSWKLHSSWRIIIHSTLHPFFYTCLTWNYLDDVWVHSRYLWLRGWMCILLITLFHFLEDAWRVNNVRQYPSHDNTLYFLWDQAIHCLCLFIFLPIGMFDQAQG